MCNVDDKFIKKLAQDVAEIKDALLGTEYIKKGLVSRVEDLETDMNKLNILRWKIAGGSVVIATAISSVISILF